MNKLQVALFFADGKGFFAGALFASFGFLVSMWGVGGRARLLARGLVGFGAVLVLLSSTPLPVALYAVAILAMGAWWITLARPQRRVLHRVVSAICVCTLLLMIAMELPRRRLPLIDYTVANPVFVIGDSLSAGTGAGERTWPQALQQSGVRVVDLSQPGATVSSALVQARGVLPGPGLVLLEIGGNDLLGSTTAADFEAGLRKLLTTLSSGERRVVMFELPLPPFSHRYGFAQRRLAREFGVTLLPKWVLAQVIGSPQTTLDGLHLSDAGHAIVAETVRVALRPTATRPE